MSLKVIKGGFKAKKKPDLFLIYLNAYGNKCKEWSDKGINKDLMKQLIFYGVKTIVHRSNDNKCDNETLEAWFELCTILKTLISELTPLELMTIFPITKTYDGAKWEIKDYYYTMDECKKIGLDTPIGDNVDDFLIDYMNKNTRLFVVGEVCIMSALMRNRGQRGIMEKFAEDMGITTHTLFENDGKQYMKNGDTGKVTRVKRSMPRYLKEV